MKKHAHKLGTIAVLALALLGLQWGVARAEFKKTGGTLKFVKGKVEVQGSAGTAWQPASLGMKVWSGDKISADNGGEVEIELEDKSMVKLKDKGLLIIERLEKQKKPVTTITALRLTSGKILGCIRKLASKDSKFTVSTPTAVAGVRGTVLGVFADGDSTELDVLKGEVGIIGEAGQEVMVGEKMMTTVPKGSAAKHPVAMTAAKIAFLSMWAGAALKVGSLGAASATAWYTSTAAIVGGATAVVAGTAAVIIVNQKKENPPAGPTTSKIPGPPGWPGTH